MDVKGAKPAIEAVIFDMDGVIVDSEPRHEQAFLEVVRELGYGDNHGINFDHYVGRSDHELWVDFVARHQPSQTQTELMTRKRGKVLEILRAEQPLFAGLYELVEALAPRFQLALASGSERAVVEAVLDFRNLRRFFPVSVSGSDIAKGKPCPDIFLQAAELLGVAPERCAVIEDSRPGVAAGRAAGMTVFAITNTHPAAELQAADHVVADYAAIAARLLPSGTPAGS